MATYGYLDSDEVLALLTMLDRGIEMYNQQDRNWKALFATDTTDQYVRVLQTTKRMEEVGSDTAIPPIQKQAYQTITLPDPKRYAVGAAVTEVALDLGVTEEQIRADYQDSYDADARLMTQYCTRAMLLDGGWWDANATPPVWAENSFQSTHDHYVAVNQSGVPTLANFITARRHIQEHGYGLGGSIACFMHGDTVGQIEKTPELATAPGPMPTTLLDQMQQTGITPSHSLSGVSIVSTDWVPENYAFFVDMAVKPLLWRNPRGRAANGALQVYAPRSDDMDFNRRQRLVRWASANVAKRSAGVAMYFSSGTWTDPTISLS